MVRPSLRVAYEDGSRMVTDPDTLVGVGMVVEMGLRGRSANSP
jgi:hypothetical protein